MDRKYVIEFIAKMTNQITAETIVDRLINEGLLHLGHGDAEVDTIVDCFSNTFGNTKTSKQDRWAANRLAKKYGSQAICGIIQLLGANSQERFSPTVNSVAQLEEKIVTVLKFLRSAKREEKIQL